MIKKNQGVNSYSLGIFLAPFIIYGITMLFSPASPSEERINNYIKRSDSLYLKIDRLVIFDLGGEKKRIDNFMPYFTNFRKNRYKNYVEFYSSTYKKYFVAENYTKTQSLGIVSDASHISGMINLDELKDSSFGSREKPVPILFLRGGTNFYESDYRFNVNEYLRFFKDRKPFNKERCMVCIF